MIPDATTTSTPAPQAAAPGSQPAPASPAASLTPVQLLWEVATLAFELMRRLVHVLQPIQQYYPKPALLLARVLIDIPRIFLTLRYAPERVTKAQLRHLTRARHLLQALFNYTLPTLSSNSPSATPLGPRTSPSATATVNQHPTSSLNPATATPLGARTPSSANAIANQHPSPSLNPSPATTPGVRTPTIRQVPEIPMVAGVSHVPASPTVDRNPLTPAPSHTSPTSHSSHNSHTSPSPHSAFRIQHSAFSPFIPDVHTLLQAIKADSLPPNCAGALFENPGEALVRALHELHAVYFSLYPNQPPTPSPSQSSGNLQSDNPRSDAPSVNTVNTVNPVNSVHPVNNVHSVYSPSPSQSEISNLKSEIPIPHSTSPP